jgi:hypothetical protein
MAGTGGSEIGAASATEGAYKPVLWKYTMSVPKGLLAVNVKSSSAWSTRWRSTVTLGRKYTSLSNLL